MFTGIVQGIGTVVQVSPKSNLLTYAVELPNNLNRHLAVGASISIDGVCQTITSIEDSVVWFDAIQETLEKTTLKFLKIGQRVNIERSARIGDEIGGHLLSGHIFGTVLIKNISKPMNQHIVTFDCPPSFMKYIFSKGYIGLNGASLTIVELSLNQFSVHLIPETLAKTTFSSKAIGDPINIEIDSQTQVIVDTIERMGLSVPSCKSI